MENQPNYDPKLSDAGFMDLIIAIQTLIQSPDGCKCIETMAEAQRAAVQRVGDAAKSYVDVVEGCAERSTCKSIKDLHNADLEKIVLAVEADAGHVIPGLRDSLVELNLYRLNKTDPSTQPQTEIGALMDQVMVIASIWTMATNSQLDAATQERYRTRVLKEQDQLRRMFDSALHASRQAG